MSTTTAALRQATTPCVTAVHLFTLAITAATLAAPAHASPDTPPNPLVPQVSVSICSLTQADFGGTKSNFEAVVKEGHRLVHYYRINEIEDSPWVRGNVVSKRAAGPGCIIRKNNPSGHVRLDVLVPEIDPQNEANATLVHYKYEPPGNIWEYVGVVTSETAGPASFIRSDFNDGGSPRFDAVVMKQNTLKPDRYLLVHFTTVGQQWEEREIVTRQATGPGSLIQSDYITNGHGDFEVVAPLVGGAGPNMSRLVHFFQRYTGASPEWVPTGPITERATGPGSLIQSDFVSQGHRRFDVVAPVRQKDQPGVDRLVRG